MKILQLATVWRRSLASVLLAQISMILASCAAQSMCGSMPQKFAEANQIAPEMELVDIVAPELDDVLRLIVECYPNTTLGRTGGPIKLIHVRSTRDEFYAFFENRNSLDNQIVFKISREGEVIEAFRFNAFSKLRVP